MIGKMPLFKRSSGKDKPDPDKENSAYKETPEDTSSFFQPTEVSNYDNPEESSSMYPYDDSSAEVAPAAFPESQATYAPHPVGYHPPAVGPTPAVDNDLKPPGEKEGMKVSKTC